MSKLKKSGGKRKGAGRKQKHGEETVILSIRVPKSKYNAARTAVLEIIATNETKETLK